MKLTAAILLFSATAFADERTLPLANPASPQGAQEMLTVLRTVIDIQKVSITSAPAGLNVQGTPEQVAAADWIIRQLDKPAGWRPSESEQAVPAAREFRMAPAPRLGNNLLRIFYVSDPSMLGIQEELTILRTVLDTSKIFQFSPLHALIYRARDADSDDIEWLLRTLETNTTSAPYQLLGGQPSNMLRVFALPGEMKGPDLARIVRDLRMPPYSFTKLFQRTTPPTIAVRGAAAQLDQAERVIVAGGVPVAPGSERTVTLLNAPPANAMKELVTIVRTVVDARNATISPDPASLILQGTPAELDASGWVIHQLDKPAGWQPSEQERKNPATREFRLSAPSERSGSVIRIFYLSDPSASNMREELNILGIVLGVSKVFQYTPLHAVIYRDAEVDSGDVEWLLQALEAGTTSAPHTLAGRPSGMLRVFALPANTTAKELGDLVAEARMQTSRRTLPPTLAVRGTAAQLDQAEKLILSRERSTP